MLRKFSELLFGKQATQAVTSWRPQASLAHRAYELEKEYIAREAMVGARVHGPIPSGHDREFYCLDEHTWVWHETWKDQNGLQGFTVHYEVTGSNILKRVNQGSYTRLEGDELLRFDKAVKAYHKEVLQHVYGSPTTSVA